MQSRSTDPSTQVRFRSDRFFVSQGEWYFNTREKTVEGPYPTREAAQAGLRDYLLRIGVRPPDVWSVGDNR